MWPRLLLLVASTLAALFLGEGILRLAGFAPLYVGEDQRIFWRDDPELGWHHRPNQQGEFQTEFFRVHVSINSRGLRDTEVTQYKPHGVRRVLAIGDSYVWGFGVESDEIFTEDLERELPATEVINGGVSGYSTDQALLWLRRDGIRYAPDVVVYVLSGNDDVMNHMKRVYWIYDKPSFRLRDGGTLELEGVPVPQPSRVTRARHWLRARSALVHLAEVSTLFHTLLPWLTAAHATLAHPLDTGDPHRLTVALVGAMRDAARGIGASLVVVSYSGYWYSPHGSYERLVGELRRAGHDVLDVEALSGWNYEAMVIQGDGHWNARGHAFVAEALLERRLVQ